MKERLLIKCDTTIYADEITNLLIENNIVSRQHDEGQDQLCHCPPAVHHSFRRPDTGDTGRRDRRGGQPRGATC